MAVAIRAGTECTVLPFPHIAVDNGMPTRLETDVLEQLLQSQSAANGLAWSEIEYFIVGHGNIAALHEDELEGVQFKETFRVGVQIDAPPASN